LDSYIFNEEAAFGKFNRTFSGVEVKEETEILRPGDVEKAYIAV